MTDSRQLLIIRRTVTIVGVQRKKNNQVLKKFGFVTNFWIFAHLWFWKSFLIKTAYKPNSFATLTQCLKVIQNVSFEFWYFPPIFVLLKMTILVALSDRKLKVFKCSPKLTITGIFTELLSTQSSLSMLNKTFSGIFKHREIISIQFLLANLKRVIKVGF